ncbi:MAG: hypothetical protein L3J93_04450 [Thermoplasmata archaeon]|nr:hypothetical protein [Thermoplasmata archaeon]
MGLEEQDAEPNGNAVGGDGGEEEVFETLRLGHDIRFVLAAVGGGGIRIAREVARRHLPYLETVAINCDPRGQDLEEFDRRICLAPDDGLDGSSVGSPQLGGELARYAEPALERVFEGATFVTIIASLGGGTGTGALPVIVQAAARASSALKVFAVKPFACESDRRALAERAIARLHFVESFVEKQQRGRASLQVLDNEAIVRSQPKMPIGHLERAWGELVARLIDRELIQPAEAVLEAERMASLARSPTTLPPLVTPSDAPEIEPLIPLTPRMVPLHAANPSGIAELTFEVQRPDSGL